MNKGSGRMRFPTSWSLMTLVRLCWSDKRRFFSANGLAILAAMCSVPLPLLMPLIVDGVLLKLDAPSVSWLDPWLKSEWQTPMIYIGVVLLLVCVLRVIALMLNVLHTRLYSQLATEVAYKLRTQLLGKLSRLTLAEHQKMGAGQSSTHLLTDVDTLHQFMATGISRAGVALVTLVCTAAVLLWIEPILGLTILLLNPVIVLASKFLGKRVQGLKRHENQAISVFQQKLLDTLEGIYTLRTSGREPSFFDALNGYADDIRQTSHRFAWQSDSLNRTSFLLYLLGFDVFRALAMVFVLNSQLSIGEMLAIFGYLWFLLSPIQELIGIQYSGFAAKAAIERINQLLAKDEDPTVQQGCDPFVEGDGCALSVDGVTFGYETDRPVLSNFSLQLQRNTAFAMTGISGGGKSTFTHLLLGCYRPQAGNILFNGVPIEQIDLAALRQAVAVVPQHPTLFNDTLRHNLTLGKVISDQTLWEILGIAQLKSLVETWEAGFDTVLGNQGMRLSGGQRQRLAIARLLLTNPSLVILDEATSALDAETEQKIHQALKPFLSQRTVLIIAHRPSALAQADEQVRLEEGACLPFSLA